MKKKSFSFFPRLCFFALAAPLTILVQSAAACPDIAGLVDLNCDGQIRVLCMGDSITAGEQDSTRLGYPGRLESYSLPGSNVKNIGVGGETTGRGRDRLNRFLNQAGSREFEYIIILEGVNDYFLDNRSSSDTRSNLFSMLRSAENNGSVSLLATLTDIRRAEQRSWVTSVNSQIRSRIKIDFFSLGTGIISSDKLHPNGAGYQRMADLAAASLVNYGRASRPADSDGDGIYDFAEARFFSDPTKNDTDGDGVPDGAEVFTYLSNPTLTDTDGDGLSDYEEEIVRHTNPLSPLPAAPVITNLQPIP